jgi:LysM repeat protein
MSAEGQSPLRVLAPASLVVFAIALLVVVALSVSGGDDRGSSQSAAGARTTKQSQSRSGRQPARQAVRPRRFYTVKPGDNLATIAEQTGVQLDQLRALNPTLDPQGLVSGQRVKLPPPGG